MIHLFALAQRWSDDETVPVVVLLELLWGHHEDIHGLSGAIQAHVNITNDLAQIVVSALDDQDIDVTMGAQLPASRRTKKDDALRLGHVHNPPDNVLQGGFAESVGLCHRCLSALKWQCAGSHRVLL